jgi:hypothetical protein
LRNWESRVAIHAESELYAVPDVLGRDADLDYSGVGARFRLAVDPDRLPLMSTLETRAAPGGR